MRKPFVVLSVALALTASAARAAAPASSAGQAQPSSPEPTTVPPAPKYTVPPAPAAQPLEHPKTEPAAPTPRAAPPPPAPAGQWSYTQQYGWIWIPYDRSYTDVVDDSALAYQYVYYPAYGWSWVLSPWVLGFGPAPYWGVFGPARFAWYAHPWFRVGTAHLRPSWGFRPGPGGFHFGGSRMGRR
jgi:hypothetical protein